MQQKTILVTGASGGIGRAIAAASAKEKHTVLIHYFHNENGAKQTLAEVMKYSSGDIFQADLTNPNEVKRLFSDISSHHVRSIDTLVNNAGDAKGGAFDDFGMWEYQFHNIFFSMVHTTNEFLKFPCDSALRKIINISSIYGFPEMGYEHFPQYSAAKAAVNSFTLTLAKKYAPDILVNAVAPGFTWTPPWEGASDEYRKQCTEMTKIKRFVHPEEIAQAVIHLLQNDAITGEIIRVDGGLHLVPIR